MHENGPVPTGRVVAGMLLLTAIAAPVLAYVWETLNRLLSGIVEPVRIAWTVPAVVLLIVILTLLRRAARAWTGAPVDDADESEKPA